MLSAKASWYRTANLRSRSRRQVVKTTSGRKTCSSHETSSYKSSVMQRNVRVFRSKVEGLKV